MASETITRNDLTAILNEVLPSQCGIEKITISGTTTSSGAIAIPSAYIDKPLLGCYRDGSPATLIYRRDKSYLVVLNASTSYQFTAYANQSVTITAWTLKG